MDLSTTRLSESTLAGGNSDINPDPQTMGRLTKPASGKRLGSKLPLSGPPEDVPGSHSDITPVPETGGVPVPVPASPAQ
jgi:hypothetical protein